MLPWRQRWRIDYSRSSATLLATAAIFSRLRAVRGLLDDGTSQKVATPSNFPIIL
uniref:Uncharacterized protein n=1 Tax=Lepeophtheirus salmonis TaxID=72036 RepID=A0A0K2UIS5_LEPSM